MAAKHMHIQITVDNSKEQLAIANAIHEQLKGNQDYIDSNIVLNIDVENVINLYIDDCEDEVPTIVI